MLGWNSAPHAIRDVLSHLVVQNGVTNAAVVETRLTAEMEAPLMRMLSSSIPPPERELSLKSQLSQSDPTLHWGEARELGLDGVNAQLRAREDDKRNHSVVRRLLNEAGNNTISPPSFCQPVELWAPRW